ncbi:MAG: hypothetical protein ACREJ9_00575 [Candidatus Rokuibacteriota bacterium]
MALRLKRLGIRRIRPLAGGFEAWQAHDFPVESVVLEPDVLKPV